MPCCSGQASDVAAAVCAADAGGRASIAEDRTCPPDPRAALRPDPPLPVTAPLPLLMGSVGGSNTHGSIGCCFSIA